MQSGYQSQSIKWVWHTMCSTSFIREKKKLGLSTLIDWRSSVHQCDPDRVRPTLGIHFEIRIDSSDAKWISIAILIEWHQNLDSNSRSEFSIRIDSSDAKWISIAILIDTLYGVQSVKGLDRLFLSQDRLYWKTLYCDRDRSVGWYRLWFHQSHNPDPDSDRKPD